MRAEDPIVRFHRKYVLDEVTGCWNWTGYIRQPHGYGKLKVFGRIRDSHKFSYEIHNGSVPPGCEVMHGCDNKRCVNPEHLSLGLHSENMKQAVERGRIRSGAQHPNFGKPSPNRGARLATASPLEIAGRRFGSIREAESAFGVAHGSVRHWVKVGKARKITREEYGKC